MKPTLKLSPILESLESRVVLSATHHAAIVPVVAQVAQAVGSSRPTMLSGRFAGTSATDSAGLVTLSGSGRSGALGRAALGGTVDPSGLLFSGRPPGQITLSNSRGSITLSLFDPRPSKSNPRPIEGGASAIAVARSSATYQFRYVVDGGTGAYASATGTGQASLTLGLQAQTGRFSLALGPTRHA